MVELNALWDDMAEVMRKRVEHLESSSPGRSCLHTMNAYPRPYTFWLDRHPEPKTYHVYWMDVVFGPMLTWVWLQDLRRLVSVASRKNLAGTADHLPHLKICSLTANHNLGYVKLNPADYLNALKKYCYFTFDGKTHRKAVPIKTMSYWS